MRVVLQIKKSWSINSVFNWYFNVVHFFFQCNRGFAAFSTYSLYLLFSLLLNPELPIPKRFGGTQPFLNKEEKPFAIPSADIDTRQPFESQALASPPVCAVLQTLSHQYRFSLKTLLMLVSPPVFEQVVNKKQKSRLVLYLGANLRESPMARYISKRPTSLFCTTTGQIISKIRPVSNH